MKNNILKFSINISLIIVLLIILVISLSSEIFRIGDMLSFGQLLVEIVLIPIVIIGFGFTVVEFRKSQETADLDIFWETISGQETKLTTMIIPSGGSGGLLTDPIAVRNQGKRITIWYQILLEFPEELYRGRQPTPERILGALRESSNADPHWLVEHGPDISTITFMSNGQFAAYPDRAQGLCKIKLSFQPDKDYPDQVAIPYKIYTDQGPAKFGELSIALAK